MYQLHGQKANNVLKQNSKFKRLHYVSLSAHLLAHIENMVASLLTLLIFILILDLESFEALNLFKFYPKNQGNLRAIIPLKEHYALLDAYFLGDTSQVSKTLKEAHRILGLTHLFSPGGFHFHACFGLVYLLIKNQKFKKLAYLYQIFLIGIQIYLLNIKGLFPLKRVIPFQILSISLKKPKTIFMIIFIFDLFVGNFLNSPISYLLSLGFWGVILFEKGFFRKTILLLMLQILCCYYFHKPFYFLSILGFILTPLISFALPLILLFYLLQLKPILLIIELNLEKFILLFSKLAMTLPPITISYSLLMLLLFFNVSRYLSSSLLFLTLIFYSPSLNTKAVQTKNLNMIKNKYVKRCQ